MSWNGVDLERVLRGDKRRYEKKQGDDVLQLFREMLNNDDELEDQILDNIFGGTGHISRLNVSKLDPENIFHIDQIRKLCTNYRLRFLDSQYFKGEVPYEAISKIKRLQRRQEKEIRNFKILAPAPMFNLKYKDKDPMLFIPLGRDRFYLVHKWGGDMHFLRRLLVFPFRNFQSLLGSVALLALLIVMSIPDSVYIGPYDKSAAPVKVIFFFYLFIAFSGLTALYGFSRMKNFNSTLWNSRYMD